MHEQEHHRGQRLPRAPRPWVLIAALACGGFGIGVSEFLVMGLLPQIAQDLLPGLLATRPDAALAASGGLASAYALGVVVGMVVTPALLRRLSERGTLIACASSMLVWTIATALAPTLGSALVLRFLAALTHASFIGVAALAAAHLLGGRSYGRGSALIHGGLAAANLLGVPALTALGAALDWRLALAGCAVFFAVPLLALLLCQPPPAPTGTVAPGGASLTGRLIALALAAIAVAGGGFAIVTFVAPVTAWTQGAGGWLTPPLAMLAFGVGMNAGNLAAGWGADRWPRAAFIGAAATGALGAGLMLVPGLGAVGAALGVACVGAMLGGGSPAAQVLFLRELPRWPRLAAALPSGAANLGSFLGSLIGGAALALSGAAAVPASALVLVAVGAVCFIALRGPGSWRGPGRGRGGPRGRAGAA
ncbi:MFS transporter [Leucobacter luti]|uniref:DHA1 family inner membrane transport protein n=1 Tax=Leucobacter luti TaxID=340320 RepID=A0A4Q7U0Y8_9MICO|nr:MFS transporter [Leucobacter luti]RZT66913.1 DHA1 family inner membrane transport protein [Leucobacter luti]